MFSRDPAFPEPTAPFRKEGMFWALSGQWFCLCEVALLAWNRDGEMVLERPRACPRQHSRFRPRACPFPTLSCLKTSWRRRACELGSQAAEFGEGLICRGWNRRCCVEQGTKGSTPHCQIPPPPPGTQTPTHLSTEGCYGTCTLGQAGGAPSAPASRSPVT